MVASRRSKRQKMPSIDLDYAKAADAVANDESNAEDDDTPEEDVDDENTDQGESDEEESVDEKNGDEGDESEEHDDEEDDDDDDDEDDGDDDDGDDDEQTPEAPVQIKPLVSACGEQVTLDLRNLLAINSHQVNPSTLYSNKKINTVNQDITILPEALKVHVNEDHLLDKATDGCAQLVSALWQLPTERSDAGPLITLPSYCETRLPRTLVRCVNIREVLNEPYTPSMLMLCNMNSLHLHPKQRRNGRNSPKKRVLELTKKRDQERFGTKPLNLGCTEPALKGQITQPRIGPSWKLSVTTILLLILGKNFVTKRRDGRTKIPRIV